MTYLFCKLNITNNLFFGKKYLAKEVDGMARHRGGKVGKAASTLASNSSSRSAKSKAGKTLAIHKANCH